MKPLKFVSISALMQDIGRGIGLANRELIVKSQTAIGALAVKTADVTVNFELTSAAARRGEQFALDAPLAGAKTLSYGTETFEEKDINRCSITLSIVSIAHKPTPEEAAGEETGIDEGGDGEDAVPVRDMFPQDDPTAMHERERLLRTIKTLKEAALRLPRQIGQQILNELNAMERMVEDGQLGAVRDAMQEFAAKHKELLKFNL